MSLIEKLTDTDNSFLSRSEIVCDFRGLGGKLKKTDAIDMITKEYKLDGKIVIPIRLKNHTGRPVITGTFYVYDDEELAKKQVNPTVFARLEKAKAKPAEAEAKPAEAKAKPAEAEAKPAEAEAKPAEAEAKPAEAEAKPAEKSTEDDK